MTDVTERLRYGGVMLTALPGLSLHIPTVRTILRSVSWMRKARLFQVGGSSHQVCKSGVQATGRYHPCLSSHFCALTHHLGVLWGHLCFFLLLLHEPLRF